jgi:uncharacterized protein YbaR (Trm112 family)
VFIELTDHLRCPASHEEAFLVLLPGPVVNRSVRSGTLGCLACGREYPIEDGVAVFGTQGSLKDSLAVAEKLEKSVKSEKSERSDESVGAEAIMAFLGLSGPGGYVALVGDAGRFAPALAGLLPGVHFAAVNPPEYVIESPSVSLLRSPVLPLKTASMRGVVLGGDYDDPHWRADAARSVLPGLRVAGQGMPPDPAEGLELLAAAGGWWVGSRR